MKRFILRYFSPSKVMITEKGRKKPPIKNSTLFISMVITDKAEMLQKNIICYQKNSINMLFFVFLKRRTKRY